MRRKWPAELKHFLRPASVLVGTGNRLRGDDAFGPLVIERLRGSVCWALLDAGESPENYIGRVLAAEPECVLFVDAVSWGGRPGQIVFLSAEDIPPSGFSTHRMSLRLTSDILSREGGCRVAILGAQPRHTTLARGVSREVEAGVDRVVAVIARLSERLRRLEAIR